MIITVLVKHGQMQQGVCETFYFYVRFVTEVNNFIVVKAPLSLDLLTRGRRDEVSSQLLDDQGDMLLIFFIVLCDPLVVKIAIHSKLGAGHQSVWHAFVFVIHCGVLVRIDSKPSDAWASCPLTICHFLFQDGLRTLNKLIDFNCPIF